MARIAAFSRSLAYRAGGAEVSTYAELEARAAAGDEIILVSGRGAGLFAGALPRMDLPAGWSLQWATGMKIFPRFPRLEYLCNRQRLRLLGASLDADELWAYGPWAPAVLLGFDGPARYFVRSENDLGISRNYRKGWKRWGRSLYSVAQLPGTAAYRRDLAAAMARSRVIANSRFMAAKARQLFATEAEVAYPRVDADALRRALAAEAAVPRYVVFAGDSEVKGLGLARQIARRLPTVSFRFFSRRVSSVRQEGNVLWSPWESESWRVFQGARLVIVPSQWEEAYGRMAREAFLLGIPVLVSNIGGLPEAVGPGALVYDYRNASAWVARIAEALADSQR